MEIVIETCLDSIKMLPFLFFAFLLIEFLEYYSGGMSGKLLKKVGKQDRLSARCLVVCRSAVFQCWQPIYTQEASCRQER